MTGDPFVLLAPRWAQMWTLALAIYIGCKWLTWPGTATGNVPAWRLLLPQRDGGIDARRAACRNRASGPNWFAEHCSDEVY